MRTCIYVVWWPLIESLLLCSVVCRDFLTFTLALSGALDTGRTWALRRIVCPKERELLNDFYSQHFSKTSKRTVPPPAKPQDEVYALVDDKNVTLAAVRLVLEQDYIFLRSLSVSKTFRRQGLATKIMEESLDEYYTRNKEICGCYCFADASLLHLYEHAGFVHFDTKTDDVPDWMWRLYSIVARRLKRKHQDMRLFIKYNEWRPNACVDVVLLQHVKEQARPTSTAPLLIDNDKNESELADHLNVNVWTWSGRADNAMVERQVDLLENDKQRVAVLLWTGENEEFLDALQRDISSHSMMKPVFIILDGTWQEARAMYRKLPILQRLPRVTLDSPSPSTFCLRNDHSGWRKKFREINGKKKHLLCTVEVVASLLEKTGNDDDARIVRRRLDAFQRNFGKEY